MRKAIFAAVLSLLAGTAFAAETYPYNGHTYTYEATPNIKNCGDPSLADAQKDGITLGISPTPPYSIHRPRHPQGHRHRRGHQRRGAALLGINKIHYEVMPFGQLISALLAHRVDLIAANIHYTPDRVKVIDFTGPAWWYGPAIVVAKGNPEHLTTFDQLKGRKVGAVVGSAADEYLRKLGADVVPFNTAQEEYAAISSARVPALVEDDVLVASWLQANKNASFEMVPNVQVPDELIYKYGYGYARYATRKQDCSLRAGYTLGLAESRGAGVVSAILKQIRPVEPQPVLLPAAIARPGPPPGRERWSCSISRSCASTAASSCTG